MFKSELHKGVISSPLLLGQYCGRCSSTIYSYMYILLWHAQAECQYYSVLLENNGCCSRPASQAPPLRAACDFLVREAGPLCLTVQCWQECLQGNLKPRRTLIHGEGILQLVRQLMRRHGPPTVSTRKIPTKWNKVDLKVNRSLSLRSYIPNDLVLQKERKKTTAHTEAKGTSITASTRSTTVHTEARSTTVLTGVRSSNITALTRSTTVHTEALVGFLRSQRQVTHVGAKMY